MKKILAVLLRPPIPHIAGLVLLTLVIFFGGRLLRAKRWLELSDGTLVFLCVLVWVVAGAVFLWRRREAQKRAQLIEDRLRGQAKAQLEATRPDRRSEVEALQQQLDEAIGALKSSKMGRSALSALPWYVIIGPPGSGKSTMLRESGLNFPHLTHGRGVRGVGGTRNCDWWFTDEGILLDTAGRYTTEAEDHDEWLAFLSMIKKTRSRTPINGAIVAISVADLLEASEEQVAEHARVIRERLAELTEKLELVFPVYLVFTKCDLLDGFAEFFGSYTKREREQIWGFTLPYLDAEPQPVEDVFAREFDSLYARITAERLRNFGGATSQRKKQKVFSFPLQFALARDHLREFIKQLAQPNPYHESSDLRGFYFTSGTQEGQPLDRVLQVFGEAIGLQAEADALVEEQIEKKAYFIDQLFDEVIFGDKELARSSAKAERRRELLQRAIMIGSAAATVLLMIMLFVAYAGHSNLIARSDEVCAAAWGFDSKDDADLKREETERRAPFKDLRELFVELDDGHGAVGTYLLGQVNQLYEQRVRPLYVEKLKSTFLAPTQAYLQQKLSAARDRPDDIRKDDVPLLADQLAAYRMMGEPDALLNRSWLTDFLTRRYLWNWRRPGDRAEIPECRPHCEVFVQRVARPGWDDWQSLPDVGLIPDVRDLVEGKDIYRREISQALVAVGQGKKMSWGEILDVPNADRLDTAVGVIAAWVHDTSLDDELEKSGERLDDPGGERLKERRQNVEIEDWLQNLADMRLRKRANLEDAIDDVIAVTGEDAPHIEAYVEVCERLSGLGKNCSAGDTTWLVETLASIASLEKPVRDLCSGKHRERIVAAAKKGESGDIGVLREEIGLVRTRINSGSKNADSLVQPAIEQSLIGLLNSIEYALAMEISQETRDVWQNGVGKQLRGFSRQFPFDADSSASVRLADFDDVFRREGEFDQVMEWIEYLHGTGLVKYAPEFKASLAVARDIQAALFATGDGSVAQAQLRYELMKGNYASAVLELANAAPIRARMTVRGELEWKPKQGAKIVVEGVKPAGKEPIPGAIDEFASTEWGLVRLLNVADYNPKVVDDDTAWVEYRWAKFVHSTGLELGGDLVHLTVRLRTESGPNPLERNFFTHVFSDEVFVDPE